MSAKRSGSRAAAAGRTALEALEVANGGGGIRLRDRIANRLSAGAEGWYIQRRNADELRLLRDLGGGYYADHILRRPQIGSTPGPATNNNVRRAHCLSDMGVGRLMVFAPLNAATYTGSWTGLSTYFAGTVPDITEGVDPVTVTITTAAGSTAATAISPALGGANTRWTTRRIIIPGAGASGADYVGTIANTGGSGATATLSPAATTAVTGATATVYPKRHSATNPATATYTAPAGSDSVGLVHSVGPNGGIWTVSIDGDLTRANCLPTAQELVDAGQAPASIMGTIAPTTRCLNFYNSAEVFTLWQALATDLSTSSTHTVVLSSTSERVAASNSTRSLIAGFGYGNSALSPLTPGASVFYTTRVSQPFPTHELAIDNQPTGATSKEFVGGNNHGYEYAAEPTITVDGVVTTVPAGGVEWVSGVASIAVSSKVYHPQVTGSADQTFNVTRTYRLDRDGLTVRQIVGVARGTVIDSAYLCMFTVDSQLDQAQVDSDADSTFNLNDYGTYPQGTYIGRGENTAASWWDSDGDVAVGVVVPLAEQVSGGWTDGVVLASIRQTAGGTKFYLRRTGTFAAGDVLASEAKYLIGRFPEGAASKFPVK